MRDRRLTDHARSMRRTPTGPEQRLWFALRAERLGSVKFRRQKVIGGYIVDFAARDPMVVVELDGDTHGGREAYDAQRSAFLEDEGYRILRFTNADVIGNLDGVLKVLEGAIATAPLPTLSPEGERAK